MGTRGPGALTKFVLPVVLSASPTTYTRGSRGARALDEAPHRSGVGMDSWVVGYSCVWRQGEYHCEAMVTLE